MIRGGKGGARTVTGLKFESRKHLEAVIGKLPGYSTHDHEVYFKGRKVAAIYRKNSLYKKFLHPRGVEYSELISYKLQPDDAIFVFSKNTLFIVEIKFQGVPGSVDEKLQTCDFKKRQYQKLVGNLKISLKYAYVLNSWFKNPRYKDVLDYIRSVGCDYFFNEVPLDYLGLPRPTSGKPRN